MWVIKDRDNDRYAAKQLSIPGVLSFWYPDHVTKCILAMFNSKQEADAYLTNTPEFARFPDIRWKVVKLGPVAKLADALDLGSSVERRAGANPVGSTKI
jgi:hypothetical protein